MKSIIKKEKISFGKNRGRLWFWGLSFQSSIINNQLKDRVLYWIGDRGIYLGVSELWVAGIEP